MMDMPYETTIDYSCGRCKQRGIKLWRGVHGCKLEGLYELLCAACLAPSGGVDEDGKAFDYMLGRRTDQVGDGLPAVPSGDSYYGYTSVPPKGLAWWETPPTAKREPDEKEVARLRLLWAEYMMPTSTSEGAARLRDFLKEQLRLVETTKPPASWMTEKRVSLMQKHLSFVSQFATMPASGIVTKKDGQ